MWVIIAPPFTRYIMRLAVKRAAQAQHFPWERDSHQNNFALSIADREFYSAATKNENAGRGVTFEKKHDTLRISQRTFHAVKCVQGRSGQVAKESLAAAFAGSTAFDNV